MTSDCHIAVNRNKILPVSQEVLLVSTAQNIMKTVQKSRSGDNCPLHGFCFLLLSDKLCSLLTGHVSNPNSIFFYIELHPKVSISIFSITILPEMEAENIFVFCLSVYIVIGKPCSFFFSFALSAEWVPSFLRIHNLDYTRPFIRSTLISVGKKMYKKGKLLPTPSLFFIHSRH